MDNLRSEISNLFSDAEKRIKIVEHVVGELTVPAINQLRYVAYHILKADNTEDSNLKKEELRKAKNHCQRAIYDAAEVGIIYFLEKIKEFKNDYSTQPISGALPNYSDIYNTAREAATFIASANKDNINDHENNRGDNYKQSIELFKKLQVACDALDNARPELNKKMERWRVGFALGLGALLLAALGIIINCR